MRRSPLLLAVLIIACSSSDAEGPTPALELPPDIELSGAASHVYPDGATVTCSFHLTILWDKAEERPDGRPVYTGRMGGESSRSVLDATGAGLSFFADMGWPASEAHLVRSDSLFLDLTPGVPPSGSPFWDAFKALEARKVNDVWSGPWTCKPMGGEAGGYVDTSMTAEGSWQVASPFVSRP